jgi:hypothetical protein
MAKLGPYDSQPIFSVQSLLHIDKAKAGTNLGMQKVSMSSVNIPRLW